MLLLYNIGLRLYCIAIYFASFFNAKAKLWLTGRKAQVIKPLPGCTWFHFASLGEFEQGRPVLEALKLKEPATKIVITFFSPSGYEVRKNTELADAVYYLPLDTAANARQFINTINPGKVVFTKYEYWYHYFNNLYVKQIPLYIISGIFRPGQVFFKWYGALHRKILKMVTHFFVQDQQSVHLLKKRGIINVTMSGDTRLDRVWANATNPKSLPEITAFKKDNNIFIAGSTWPEDETLLVGLINEYPKWKFIIAPHEISLTRVTALQKLLPAEKTMLFSQIFALTPKTSVLVIDNIGMLSALYQYADVAYIGGGFGRGIHNTLEAAAFGLPVIFGPNYTAFKEAKDLINLKAGFSIKDIVGLRLAAAPLMANPGHRQFTGQLAKDYVWQNIGATGKIIELIS